jgi:hypothetical protein
VNIRVDIADLNVFKQIWITAIAEGVQDSFRIDDAFLSRDRGEPTEIVHPGVVSAQHLAVKYLPSSRGQNLKRPSPMHKTQKKLCRSRAFDPPRTNVTWRAFMTSIVATAFSSQKTFYIG